MKLITTDNCADALKSLSIIQFEIDNNKYKNADLGKCNYYLVKNLEHHIDHLQKHEWTVLDNKIIKLEDLDLDYLIRYTQNIQTLAINLILTDYVDDAMISNHRASVLISFVMKGENIEERKSKRDTLIESYKYFNGNWNDEDIEKFIEDFDLKHLDTWN